MSNLGAISGEFTSIKHVPSRSVMQIIIEVSINDADRALQSLGGVPVPGATKHVALALLNGQSIDNSSTKPNDVMVKARTRAIMLCNDERFANWVARKAGIPESAINTANFIRNRIGGSRSLIASNRDAYEKFITLETEFKQATGQMAEARF